MKASELITKLNCLIKRFGDVPVSIMDQQDLDQSLPVIEVSHCLMGMSDSGTFRNDAEGLSVIIEMTGASV